MTVAAELAHDCTGRPIEAVYPPEAVRAAMLDHGAPAAVAELAATWVCPGCARRPTLAVPDDRHPDGLPWQVIVDHAVDCEYWLAGSRRTAETN